MEVGRHVVVTGLQGGREVERMVERVAQSLSPSVFYHRAASLSLLSLSLPHHSLPGTVCLPGISLVRATAGERNRNKILGQKETKETI